MCSETIYHARGINLVLSDNGLNRMDGDRVRLYPNPNLSLALR